MNSKKAKAIRKLAKEAGQYKKEPNYTVKETKKMIYFNDKDGNPQAEQVSRYTVINLNRVDYRRMKREYKNGELAV